MVRCDRYNRLVPTDKVYRKSPATLTCAAAANPLPVTRTKTTDKQRRHVMDILIDTLVDTSYILP